MKKIIFFLSACVFITVSACAKTLTAEIRGTTSDSTVSGEVQFHPTPDGVRVLARVEGVSPGKHGFHIHEKGDCGDGGNAAGGHFNPDGHAHGDAARDGIGASHAGDLGNIEVGPDGKGGLEKTIVGLTIESGKYGVAGRSVILHEKEDDFGQPLGNAGGRIGCAEIPS